MIFSGSLPSVISYLKETSLKICRFEMTYHSVFCVFDLIFATELKIAKT